MPYLKSRDFPIHLLCYWWTFWLLLSQSSLSVFQPPSLATMLQYALLVISFLAGHLTIKHLVKVMPLRGVPKAPELRADTTRVKLILVASSIGSGLLLLISLKLSGAFNTNFVDYFLRLRVESASVEELTGNHYLDVLTKVVAFPLSYTIILVILANEARYFKSVLIVCICNLLAYSYLWQVNYPLIHLFWILVFYLLLSRRSNFNIKTLLVVSTLFATLLISAANRFGGDVFGGFQRYIVGYHLLGFSFYDYQYNNPHSILHSHSYGRSSLGFLDQMLQVGSKLVGGSYEAASSDNSTYNNEAVDIGRNDLGSASFNAFGTILFSLYRDFDLVGIWLGGFVYGAAVTQSLYRSTASWIAGALFLCLASSWMMGMMVSPLEQAYFWFAIVVLGLIGVINRGIKW